MLWQVTRSAAPVPRITRLRSTAMPSSLSRRSLLAATGAAGAALALGAASARAAAPAGTAPAAPAAPPAPPADSGTLTLTARPSAESERLRLATALRGSEFQPTGRHVPAGTPLTFNVLPYNGLVPTLWVGTWDYYGTVTEPRSYPLVP